MWNLAAVRTEWILIGASALLAAFVLRLADIGLDGRTRPATRYALRTLALWFVVQGFVLLTMIALTSVTMTLLVWLFCWTLGVAIALAVFRLGLSVARHRSLHVPCTPSRVAIVGGGEWLERLADSIDTAGASRYRFVGAYRTTEHAATFGEGAFVATDLASFAALARTERVDEIWIALPLDDDATITRVIDEFRHDFVELRLMPDVSKHALFGSRVEDILGEPAISLAAPPLSRGARLAKAIFDRAFAAVVLVGLMPLLLVVAAVIKLTSPGPVLFTQKRRGADGQTFDIYKFRTMRVHVEPAGTVAQATRNDPRVTKVGAFLRRTSLDELPATCRWSARARMRWSTTRSTARSSTATSTDTGSSPASPAGRKSTGCAARPNNSKACSPASSTTSTTCATGRSRSICESSVRRCCTDSVIRTRTECRIQIVHPLHTSE
jgi:hypothetical protein